MPEYLPRLIAWEITRACPLRCVHCRAAAQEKRNPGELSTDEILAVMKDIASFARPIIILTGGEPMAREDVYDLARAGTEMGLRMVMAPCGMLVDRAAARRMREAGIQRISLSIDGASAASHDGFRGVPGAFESVLRAAEAARAEGLPFQVNTTVTRINVDELPAILTLSREIGAMAFHPFLLVPTGRGKSLADQEIPPERYEEVLRWVAAQPMEDGFLFKPTCAPHYVRILKTTAKERRRAHPHGAGHPGGHPGDLDSITRGCMGGVSFAFIGHTGQVQMCGFLDVPAGDLREAGLSFAKVWRESRLFSELRDPDLLGGKCGVCEFRKVCAGCRARAFAMTGDYLAEEPFCIYEPRAARE